MATIREAFNCPCCNAPVYIPRKHVNHVLHLILSIFTLGLWLPIWLGTTVGVAIGQIYVNVEKRCRNCNPVETRGQRKRAAKAAKALTNG